MTDAELADAEAVLATGWLNTDLETVGREHGIGMAVPTHLAQVHVRTEVLPLLYLHEPVHR